MASVSHVHEPLPCSTSTDCSLGSRPRLRFPTRWAVQVPHSSTCQLDFRSLRLGYTSKFKVICAGCLPSHAESSESSRGWHLPQLVPAPQNLAISSRVEAPRLSALSISRVDTPAQMQTIILGPPLPSVELTSSRDVGHGSSVELWHMTRGVSRDCRFA